ncbi:MAG: hypothetical protein WCH98_00750 [Verrucomicrobiota bacterium]
MGRPRSDGYGGKADQFLQYALGVLLLLALRDFLLQAQEVEMHPADRFGKRCRDLFLLRLLLDQF